MTDWLTQYIDFVMQRLPDILNATVEHVYISLVSVLLGCLVAIPFGIYLATTNRKWVQSLSFGIANIFQTIPSLALLALMIPLLGIGLRPAITALFLYSLLPILRNTFAGIKSVDPDVIESAKGMGFNRWQRLWQIQLPLAFPYMMSGIRVTTVYIISWTTLASLIGAGGLGLLIFSGMGVNNRNLIITGALVAITLALLSDFILGRIEKRVGAKSKATKPEVTTDN